MNCSVNEDPIIITSGATTSTTGTSNPNSTTTSSTTTNNSESCSNNGITPPASQLIVVEKVAEETDDLYQTNPNEFTQRVAECLRDDINENWGLRLDDSGVTVRDIVAYRMGENANPYSVDILETTSEQIQWLVQGDSDECGQVGGTWQSVSAGECILDNVEEKCTEEQLADDYETVNEQCLPKCERFAESNAEGVEIAIGDKCNDTVNYNISFIQGTSGSQLDEPQTCCRISSKRSCPSGYQFIEGNCQPMCTQAAKLAGYTSSQSHLYDNGGGGLFTTNTSNCQDLKYEGNEDWRDFSFYDPYRFLQKEKPDAHIYEIQPDSEKYGCCITGSQDTTSAHSYDSKGWHPIIDYD